MMKSTLSKHTLDIEEISMLMIFRRYVSHYHSRFLVKEKDEYNVSAKDLSKALLDVGIHPPTMYFPQIVHEALMIEPNETESKETLDFAIKAFRDIYDTAMTDGQALRNAALTTPVKRVDDVLAARSSILIIKKQ